MARRLNSIELLPREADEDIDFARAEIMKERRTQTDVYDDFCKRLAKKKIKAVSFSSFNRWAISLRENDEAQNPQAVDDEDLKNNDLHDEINRAFERLAQRLEGFNFSLPEKEKSHLEIVAISFELMRLFKGYPICVVENILDNTKAMIKATHEVSFNYEDLLSRS